MNKQLLKAIVGQVRNDSPSNTVVIRKDLTDYAFGLTQDVAKVLRVANLFAPVVPTGATSGRFNKFNAQQDFKDYSASAKRAVGGQANRIGFLSNTANYNVSPYALSIAIDNFEVTGAGSGGMTLLEQSKTRTLTVNSAVAHAANVISTVNSSISATAGVGAWNDPAVDPIAEIDAQVLAVWRASGVLPNVIAFDIGSWFIFKNHPKVVSRLVGAEVATLTPERAQTLFVNPNARIEIVDVALLTGGGLGNASATKTGLLGGQVYVFASSESTATPYDPSFAKTFSVSANMFTGIQEFIEGANVRVLQNDWSADVQVVSTLLCKRISVTGGNG